MYNQSKNSQPNKINLINQLTITLPLFTLWYRVPPSLLCSNRKLFYIIMLAKITLVVRIINYTSVFFDLKYVRHKKEMGSHVINWLAANSQWLTVIITSACNHRPLHCYVQGVPDVNTIHSYVCIFWQNLLHSSDVPGKISQSSVSVSYKNREWVWMQMCVTLTYVHSRHKEAIIMLLTTYSVLCIK